MRYLAWTNNKAKDATITSSGAAAGFPASNLANFFVPEAWHSTGSADSWVELDLGSAQTLDTFGLVGHNFTSAATVTVKRGASANPSTESDTLTYREFDMVKRLAATESYRYVRFTISDAANGDGFHSFGVPWVGANYKSIVHYSPEWSLPEIFINREQRTDVGVLHSEVLARQHQFNLTFAGLDRTEEQTEYNQLIRDSKGSANPLFVILNDDNDNDVYQVRAMSYGLNRTDQYGQIPLTLVEDIRGVVVGA